MRPKHLPAAAFALFASLSITAPAQPVITPGLFQNVELKQSLRSKSAAEQAAAIARYKISTELLAAEAVALYVNEPLDRQQIQALAAQGIKIHEEQYVPPVAGRHPHGFYLATIAHSALPQAIQDKRFVRLASTEMVAMPSNDLGKVLTGVDLVHAGTAGLADVYTGAGVKVAVADSGFDTDHPDLPVPVEGYNVVIGTSPISWTTGLKYSGDRHGTHVAGTVLGRGTHSAGQYRGMAPDADFYAYRISNSTDGSAFITDMIEAINRASQVGCQVFNLSYGGYEFFPDGSSATCQAIDAAFQNGMVTAVSAGNSQRTRRRVWGTLAPGASASFVYTAGNGTAAYAETETIQLSWLPGDGELSGTYPMSLNVLNLGAGESFTTNDTIVYTSQSSRGQKTRLGQLVTNVPAGSGNKNYTIVVANPAESTSDITFHLYCYPKGSTGFFPDASNAIQRNFTVNSPSVADSAISVAAWVHRKDWLRYDGLPRSSSETVGTIATFSSFGPRIDMLQKPDLIAPGSSTISLHTSSTSGTANNIVAPGNTLETARYYVLSGTSMASPHVAGLAALLWEAVPTASAQEIRQALLDGASKESEPDFFEGYGMPNVAASIVALEAAQPTGVFYWQMMD